MNKGIHTITEQKYFNFLKMIQSKTKTIKHLKTGNLCKNYKVSPAVFVALDELGIIQRKNDIFNKKIIYYKWIGPKPSRKMAIEVIKEGRPKPKKNITFSDVTDLSKGVENSNAKPIFCKQVKNGEVEPTPIKNKVQKRKNAKCNEVKKEEKTAVNISLFWGLFKITLKK